ncbi:glutathione S-transferase family protein [Magnetospira sp. QH-2]|uniref:glutathione S-transferase family protein n=1 Tax=Magnetospira sp. (strain QH-2) TaxID=1288970 RepID=UPI0003E815CA|nr:glutathione binding-like protein [Magnetospira sp. QH-2]CCQ72687.1 Glutathione S-transferase [Magnetospira sp. QH-2]
MIDLYTFATPNGKKASVMLEEVGLDYQVHVINIMKNDQFKPDFLKISPNNKIPAIIDSDGPGGQPLSLFESGAILIYLAEKCGRDDLLPPEGEARYTVLQWLMWQMGGFGPMLGQANHFLKFAKEDVPYAKTRYHDETVRLYGVLDRHLSNSAYLAGETYTIADIATLPWTLRHEFHGVDLADFPAVEAWAKTLKARPAVQKGLQVPEMP